MAASMASGSRGSTTTRSSPKTSTAIAASASTSVARGLEFAVITTSAKIGSKASRRPLASLSPLVETTPMSREKPKASLMPSAIARAPCGLCAASRRTVGEERTISRRPGEATWAKARRTVSMSRVLACSAPIPKKASTAASATAALCAW
ncbi:hypothetical protein STANM309S_03025 [Streptomyces tanashiensis]